MKNFLTHPPPPFHITARDSRMTWSTILTENLRLLIGFRLPRSLGESFGIRYPVQSVYQFIDVIWVSFNMYPHRKLLLVYLIHCSSAWILQHIMSLELLIAILLEVTINRCLRILITALLKSRSLGHSQRQQEKHAGSRICWDRPQSRFRRVSREERAKQRLKEIDWLQLILEKELRGDWKQKENYKRWEGSERGGWERRETQ